MKKLVVVVFILLAQAASAQVNFGRLANRLPAAVLADGPAGVDTFLRGDLTWQPVPPIGQGLIVLSKNSCPASFFTEGYTFFGVNTGTGTQIVKMYFCRKV